MTPITDMALPDAVVLAAYRAFRREQGTARQSIDAAIRAALQAMLDNGMAEIMEKPNWGKPSSKALIIRLDADERKRGEGKEGEKDGM